MTDTPTPATRGATAFAWAAHAFTAAGSVVALLALLAVEAGRENEALLWLFAALVIDGVDGTIARAANVRERLPRIDGDALDLVIDYLTYVFIPVMFVWRGGYLPNAFLLPLGAAILVSSLYIFARRDMKTADGYFRGFPALWNVVAFYFFATSPDPYVAAAIVAVLVLMTFAPVHVVHPFRVRDYGRLLPLLSLAWAAVTVPLLLPGVEGRAAWLLAAASAGISAILMAMGLLRTIRGPSRQ